MEACSAELAQPRQASIPRLGPLTRRANRRIYEEVHEAALKVEGSVALGAYAMRSVLKLDAHRQSLSQGDPVTNALLSDLDPVVVVGLGRQGL
jgi:hypothetical protein